MATNKSRLGRGLSSLLSVSGDGPAGADHPTPIQPADPSPSTNGLTGGTAADGQLFHVELSRVTANPHQPRRTFDDLAIAGLAESLKTSGLIQPIVVRAVGDRYELVAGERRWRAAQQAGLTHLPALLRRVTAAEQAELALVENIHRADLNPIERALAYKSLLEHLGLTQEALAQRLGEDRSGVANHLRLLDLCEPVRRQVAAGALSLGHAKVLAGVQDLLAQQRLGEQAAAQQLSVRALERLVQTARPARKPTAVSPSAHIADLEHRLTRGLQMRVQVRQAGDKRQGQLVIHYASLDQFDDLLSKLGLTGGE